MKFNKSEKSDEVLEKLKYYDKNKDIIAHQKRQKDYLEDQRNLGKFLENNTYVGKVLKENNYQIFDIHQAQEDFRKVMGLDKIKEIAGVYTTTKFKKDMAVKSEHIVKITKANFWNAFYEPIWKNLTDSEKIKSFEWMFETINEKYNLGIKHINYFINDDFGIDIVLKKDWEHLNGLYNFEQNMLFLNLDRLSKPNSYFAIPLTLAHELMHARQGKYVKNFDYKNPRDFYTLTQTELASISHVDLTLSYHLDYATEYALYRVSKSEKVAELMGLKTINKIRKLNQEQFGKNKLVDKNINNSFEIIKNEMLFSDTKKYGKGKHRRFEATDGIITNEEIVLKGQSENLLKLIVLKNFYESEKEALSYSQKFTKEQIDELIKKYNDDFSTYDEFLNEYGEKKQALDEEFERLENCIIEDEEKLSLIKATFLSTLKYGKIPENFDAKKEFEILNLIEEPNIVYSLPRWLHQDEDKKRKHINSQKRKFKINVNHSESNETLE